MPGPLPYLTTTSLLVSNIGKSKDKQEGHSKVCWVYSFLAIQFELQELHMLNLNTVLNTL